MARRVTVVVGVVLIALVAAPPPVVSEGWPFGSGGGLREGKDLYNLGILGAKVRDADAEPAPDRLQTGRRRVSMGAAPANDEGPERLAVELLYPDGSAEKAGLRVGDVIVGVSGRRFREGSLTTMAGALRKAESGKGKLGLIVEREGVKGSLEIAVQIPAGGRAYAKPTTGDARRAIADGARRWLASRQEEDGGFRQTLSGINGAVVQTSLAGLAWLAGGSTAKTGPFAENVSKAARFVAENVGKTMAMPGRSSATESMRGLDQTNWGYAHAAIFLGELQAREPDPDVSRALRHCGQELAERQEESGGWAHGPGGPNPLGYLELNIVSGLALCGMGMARHSGFTPPEDVVVAAEAYLEASGGGDGGVGYSTSPGQKGMGNIGRTAISWLGLRTLGRGKLPWTRKMGRYVAAHVADLSGAHASLMQHVLFAGMAANALGAAGRRDYWAKMERDFILARAPDGSFQPRPWHESLAMGSNSDVSFGEVWTTAAWTIVLGDLPALQASRD